jgi:hypothetical protein
MQAAERQHFTRLEVQAQAVMAVAQPLTLQVLAETVQPTQVAVAALVTLADLWVVLEL